MLDPSLGPVLQGAGGIFSTAASMYEADVNRRFQYDMSSTAHQREVKDLRAAGLNPILSAGGSGATTPTGAMVTPGNPFEGITKALSDAQQAKNLAADTANKEKNSALIDAQKANVDQDTIVKMGQNVLNSSANLKTLADRDVSVGQLKVQTAQAAQAWQQSLVNSAQAQNLMLENSKQQFLKSIYESPAAKAGQNILRNFDPEKALPGWQAKLGFTPSTARGGATGGF